MVAAMHAATYLTLSTIIAWLAATVLVFGLFAGWCRQRWLSIKGKKLRRCPKCWYDLSATPGLTCSECGYTARHERKLYKSRRRWKLVFLAIFLFLGSYALRITPAVKQRGWPAAVPTTGLLIFASADLDDWFNYDFGRPVKSRWTPEFYERAKARTLWSWQWQTMLDQMMANSQYAWPHVYTRKEWPPDVPVLASAHPPMLFDLRWQDLLLRSRLAGTDHPWVVDAYGMPGVYLQKTKVGHYGSAPRTDGPVEFEIEIWLGVNLTADESTQTTSIDESRAYRAWHGTITADSKYVANVADVMNPYHREGVNDAVALLGLGLQRDWLGRIRVIQYSAGYHRWKYDHDWTMGARVDILRDGASVATGKILHPIRLHPGMGHQIGGPPTYPLEWKIPLPETLDGHEWKIRLRGDLAIALGDFHSHRYWDGEVEFPVHTIDEYE